MEEIRRRNNNNNKNADDSRQPTKHLHVLMEKPMSTDIDHALSIHSLVEATVGQSSSSSSSNNNLQSLSSQFWINHSANYRLQTKLAREVIASGQLGKIKHVNGNFASPLMWIFDDPSNTGWNVPTGNMIGNGFAWGQSSHLFAWIYHVCPNIIPTDVYCTMTHSSKTGADISHSATIRCKYVEKEEQQLLQQDDDDNDNTVVLNIGGTSLLPGNAHSDPPVPKTISIQIYGTNGSLLYEGNDRDPDSGRLEYRHPDGTVDILLDDFHFENLDNDGYGPESLQYFVNLCYLSANNNCNNDQTNNNIDHEQEENQFYVGADVTVGLRSIQTIDAMYRSHASSQPETVRHD